MNRKTVAFIACLAGAVACLAAELRVERRKPLTANVGVVSVGLDTYWTQCPGLLDDMVKKEDTFVRKLNTHQVKVSRFGMSDNPAKAKSLIPAMKAADLDVLFVDMVTYATSSTFAPFVRELNVPIVLFALQPDDRLDYAHATIYKQLYNDDLCSVPEFTGVAERYGRPVADVVIGKLEGDARTDEEIRQWCAVAHVLHDLRRARIGLMGHVLEAMYDMQVDPTAVSRTFGCHVALCEPDEILPYYRQPIDADVAAMKKRILSFFDTPDPVSDPWTEKLTERDLDVAAKAACALEKFIEKRNLDGFAYYYEGMPGSDTRELVTNFIVGNSLLTAAGFPMCGEFDLKNCVAMMIFDRLEIGGSFAEFHPIDFERDTVLVGHDGPHHLNIAQSKPVLRSLKKYHGKPGKGAGVEFNIQEGPITMMSLGLKRDGTFKFIVAEGESLKGPIPPTGNTNTHGKFLPDVRTFLQRWTLAGPTHHFALGIGHHAAELKKLGKALGIEVEVVTPPTLAQPKAKRPVPNARLMRRIVEGPEIIGIVHWGLNTYTDREWGYGDENPKLLNPLAFDANQIAESAKAGDIGGLVVVAKHHDGFCLWPTKTTEHNITKSPFRGGKGDYVKEMEQACRKAGIGFGVYCSPWDRNSAHYATDKYVEIYHAQLRELLGGTYGEVFEMWFDGANGGDGYYGGAREKRKIGNDYYRFGEVRKLVYSLQPKTCTFGLDDFAWPGNEQGLIQPESRATRGNGFSVYEADFPLRPSWFYHAGEKGRSKHGAYLMKLYLSSVGNGGIMNIGLSPNHSGLLDAEDVTALKNFKTLKDAFFAKEVTDSGDAYNVVVMRENLANGEQVDGWEYLADGKAVLSGKTIGVKRIRVLEKPIAAAKSELKITSDGGRLLPVEVKRYFASPELVKLVMSATTSSGETDTAKWMLKSK